MADTKGRGTSPSRGFFHKDQEARLLAQAVGEPSGIIAAVGGLDFDLVPLATGDGVNLVLMIPKLAFLWSKAQAGELKDAELNAAMESDLPWALGLIKSVLRDSARCADPDGFDESVFDAWYAQTRFIPTLETLVPKILRTNGMDSFADQLENLIARFKNKPDPSLPATTPEVESAQMEIPTE